MAVESRLNLDISCQFVSLQNCVLQGSRREAIADQFNSIDLTFQLAFQSTDRLAAERVDARVIRTHFNLLFAPDIFNDDGTGMKFQYA